MQPLYVAACNAGVRILLQHRMTAVHREASPSGRVTGIAADHNGTDRNIRAQKAVVIATGGWRVPMPPQTLAGAVSRYNGFVESGADLDFEKPRPLYKIAKPPFYAAWATPVIHDTRAGLRINARCQVLSLDGAVIPSLYCGGESAGGFSMHGLPRALCQGFIAGRNAAAEVSHG
jgi:succinate dehydrogenase/fumarate reductase flavoprotein subunit